MMEDSSYGSSEYSPEAEDLFAQYLLARDVGEAVDFEAFAEEHAEYTEELYGLHTDWDNVRGLLGRLETRRSTGAIAAEPEAQLQPDSAGAPESAASTEAQPSLDTQAPLDVQDSPEPAEAPAPAAAASESTSPEGESLDREFEAFGSAANPPQRRSSRPLVGALVAAVLVVGYVAVDLYRSREVLAREAEELSEQRTQARTLLDDVRAEHLVLQTEHVSLVADLAGEREVLAERERELELEREAARMLEAEKQDALSELGLEEQRAAVLARSVRCEVLRSSPLLHSSTLREDAAELESWRAEALELLAGRAELQSRREDLVGREGPGRREPLVADLGALLSALDALEPLAQRVSEELDLLARVQTALDQRPVAAKPAGLPRGVVLYMMEDATGRLRLGYRDLAVEFASDALERVPGRDLLLLPRWDDAQLSAEDARLATRLGYGRLSRLEVELLSLWAGLQADSRRVSSPGWALGSL